MQSEFPQIVAMKRRDELLAKLRFDGSSNHMKLVLRALLTAIARFTVCYQSQATLSEVTLVPRRTLQRALQYLTNDAGILLVTRQSRCGAWVNHYSINWPRVEELVSAAEDAPQVHEDAPQVHEDAPQVHEDAPQVHEDAPGSGAQIETTSTRETTTTTTREQPVVVSLRELGVVQAEEAYRIATGIFSDAEISERIQAFREEAAEQLPSERKPGKLYRWLTILGSFHSGDRGQVLRLRPGLEPEAERRRAALIQYGKGRGWTFQELQNAVSNFELEQLLTSSCTN